MCEVTGPDNRDTLQLRPFPNCLGTHILARGAGIVGMHMEVGDKLHGAIIPLSRNVRNRILIPQKSSDQSHMATSLPPFTMHADSVIGAHHVHLWATLAQIPIVYKHLRPKKGWE